MLFRWFLCMFPNFQACLCFWSPQYRVVQRILECVLLRDSPIFWGVRANHPVYWVFSFSELTFELQSFRLHRCKKFLNSEIVQKKKLSDSKIIDSVIFTPHNHKLSVTKKLLWYQCVLCWLPIKSIPKVLTILIWISFVKFK